MDTHIVFRATYSTTRTRVRCKAAFTADHIMLIKHGKQHTKHNRQIPSTQAMSIICFNQPHPQVHPAKRFHPVVSTSCWFGRCSSCSWAWMDLEWSLRFTQYSPLKSWQPCLWAESKKSVAVLFCNIAYRILSTSSNNSEIAVLVALLNLSLAARESLLSRILGSKRVLVS